MEPGHSHMECDTDHSVIERAKKKYHTEIHHPEDCYQLVRTAKSKEPFQDIEISQQVIFDFEKMFS